jgi:hypothetical protein
MTVLPWAKRAAVQQPAVDALALQRPEHGGHGVEHAEGPHDEADAEEHP